ncbi:MAG: HPr family phosphocarrier protein [Lachnospiraceae bacterium]|nr:HPr family phosphocarrier protein [Lachnospiraceae bacterium]
MLKKDVIILVDGGAETRPVALLVQVASQFRSDIYLETGNCRVNAKSIMGMMTMGLDPGEEVTISVNGEDEEEAMAQLQAYLTKAE